MQFQMWLEALRHRVQKNPQRRESSRRSASRQRPVEALEDRALLSVSSLIINGELSILSDADDNVTVRTNPVDGVSLQVIENGTPSSTIGSTLVENITSINIRGGAGANAIDLSGVTSAEFTNLTSVSVTGNDGNDTILGTADFDDVIVAGDGNDIITTGTGANNIDGGDGHDTITADAGADTIEGGDGHDMISAGDDNDSIIAGDGNDTVSGDTGDDTITAGDGNDLINGNDGLDQINGGFGDDILMGDTGNDTILGGAGADTIGGGADDDSLVGNAQNDVITGDLGNDTIIAGSGNDSVGGGAGDDFINGQGGDDTLAGDDGNDRALGGGGDDLVSGGEGDDSLVGNGGSDTLRGENGMDSLSGGAGSDRLEADVDRNNPAPTTVQARLFVLPIDGLNQFVEIDPVTGDELRRIAAPEPFSGQRDGLAFDGTHLFYMNGAGSDTLYQIDPETQTIVDADPITAGTGEYDGLAVIGGLVYILDTNAIDIHVFDPATDTVVNTLDINSINPTVSVIAGGLAGAANPDRLIATEAGGSRVIEIDPLTGVITSSFVPGTISAGQYFGAAVINGEIYLGSGTQASYDVFSRQGIFLRNVTLPYNVSAFGGDDIGTSTVPVGSTPAEVFNIDVRFAGLFTPTQQDLINAAARRWEEIIVGDVPDVFVPGVGQVDDIAIEFRSNVIDGPGSTLAQAGLVAQRVGSNLPSAAFVEFDTSDVAALESSGQLRDTVLHEMGHALGFGAIWDDLGLISGAGGPDPRFLGPMSVQEYNLRFGTSETSVPVENMGGPGTADVHWRESVLTNELMTGFLDVGVSNPITRLTVAQFADLGYSVDFTAADTLDTTSLQATFSLTSSVQRVGDRLVGQLMQAGTGGADEDTSFIDDGSTSQFGQESGFGFTSYVLGKTTLLDLEPMMVMPGLDPEKAATMTPEQLLEFNGELAGSKTSAGADPTLRLQTPEIEPNNTFSTAVNIDNLGFSLEFDANIGDSTTNTSTTIPHLTILGTGDGSYDFYSFTVSNAGDRGIFDIDFGSGNSGSFDAELFVFDSLGNLVLDALTGLPAQNDDTSTTAGAGGSTSSLDSFVEVTFPAPGTYVVGVAAFSSSAITGGITGATIPFGADYQLQVSIENHLTSTGGTGSATPQRVFGDILIGGTGNGAGTGDMFFGSPGDDRIVGSNENDTIFAGDGMDSIFAGSGDDEINGEGGNDTIRGNGGADTINGGAGDDHIGWRVNDGNDSIQSSEGLDTVDVDGTSANDTFTIGGSGTDLQITYDATAPTPDPTLTIQSGTLVVNVNGLAGNDTFNFDPLDLVNGLLLNVNGGAGQDTYNADGVDLSGIRVAFDAGVGNDTITGGTSSETIIGGDGDDVINGGGGNDSLEGGAGDDVLSGNDGNDTLRGGTGIDVLNGGNGDDSLAGDLNNDTLNGNAGNDSMDGGHGADSITGADGNDTALGADGNDTITGDAGRDFLVGGSDDDSIVGGDGDDTLRGGDGEDFINGNAGNDVVNGGDGDDSIFAGAGDDTVTGGDGHDFVQGQAGEDVLLGGDGNDILNGGGGNDIQLGGDGNDTVNGNSGTDTLAGNQGSDRVANPTGADVVNEMFQLAQSILTALEELPPTGV